MKYVNSEAIDWAFACVVLNLADKLVLLAIAKRANKHWASFPGRAEIAQMTGVAEASIVKCIRRLERAGLLKRVPFTASNGQDQKVGYVLAGGGRALDSLDAAFLDLAFADRKQPGAPLATNPQHWSGERTGEGGPTATLPGWPHSHPEGGYSATPRRKEIKEDQKEEEDGAVARDDDRSSSLHQKPAAIAGVAPEAPTPAAGNFSTEISIPTQRAPRTPNLRQQRDDDWVAQVIAVPPDLLETAIDSYRNERDGLYEWARREAAGELGLNPALEYGSDVETQLLRGTYLFLLKKHAADGDPAGDELMWPLDETIQAAPQPYGWVEYCPPPDGQSAEEFAEAMCQTVLNMTAAECGLQIAEIRKVKSGVWRECRDKAKAYLRSRKVPVESEAMNNCAIQYAILRYQKKGEWPMAMVPRSMRPVSATADPPPWAA